MCADISMCVNKECTLKESCYRQKAYADKFRQAYGDFKQDKDGNCDYYWKINDNEQQTKKK